MTSDLDIYRSANLPVERYGEDAPIHAAMSADKMMAKGNLDGFAVWRLIILAVDELLAKATQLTGVQAPSTKNRHPGKADQVFVQRGL